MEKSTADTYASKISTSFNKAFTSIKSVDTGKIIASINENMIVIVVNILLIIAVALMIWNYSYNRTLENTLCKKMNAMYPDVDGKIAPINNNNVSKNATNNFKYKLRDYYIKTAYNACNPGNYKNSAVSLCSLKDVIKQGVRCFDFEIYSLDNNPIVASSMDKNFHVKETFNYVPFGDVLVTLREFAYSSSGCPNPNDPIIIHLRMQSTNQKMFSNMAVMFKNMSEYVLGSKYSDENGGNNLGDTPLLSLRRKIVVIADKSNSAFLENKALNEFINMTSNSVFMRALRYTQGVKHTPDMDELKEFNKQNMTIVLPDDKNNPENPGSIVSRTLGCQFVAMRYQSPDSMLREDTDYFDNNGHAFVLKPRDLRYIPVYIKKPPPPDKKLSYAPREMKSNQGLYDFEI